jgi:hypothetical protein
MVVETALKPSRIVQAAVALLALAAALAVLWVPVPDAPFALKTLAAIGIAAIGALAVVRQSRAPSRLTWLRLDALGGVVLRAANGQELRGQLAPGSTVLPYFVSLVYRPGQPAKPAAFSWLRQLRHPAILLLPDRVDADTWRRLSVLLRWGTDGRG